MIATAPANVRLAKIRFLLLLTIPLGAGTVVSIRAIHLELPDVLALCGLIVAIVGGCTKIGSP
jgi:hypothetical protein